MPTWVLQLFDIIWLLAILVLLVRVAVTSSRVQRALLGVIERAQEANRISAQAAEHSAQTAKELAHVVATLQAPPAK